MDWEALVSGEEVPKETFQQQVMLFAYSILASSLVLHAGLKPYAVIGHSAGELPGAYLAGAFDLQSCVDLLRLGLDFLCICFFLSRLAPCRERI